MNFHAVPYKPDCVYCKILRLTLNILSFGRTSMATASSFPPPSSTKRLTLAVGMARERSEETSAISDLEFDDGTIIGGSLDSLQFSVALTWLSSQLEFSSLPMEYSLENSSIFPSCRSTNFDKFSKLLFNVYKTFLSTLNDRAAVVSLGQRVKGCGSLYSDCGKAFSTLSKTNGQYLHHTSKRIRMW